MKYVKVKSSKTKKIKSGFEEGRKEYTQYMDDGYKIRPAGNVRMIQSLYPMVYSVDTDMNGLYLTSHPLNTDELLRFEDDRQQTVLGEIQKFWKLENRFKKLGFIHKRGILLYGDPGTGKSCVLKLVVEDVINEGDLVLQVTHPGLLQESLNVIRQVEPNRRVLAILEDVDRMVDFAERELLQLFDGDSQHDNIVFLGTTNYLHKLPPRMTRTGRFDRVIEIGNPGADGRRAYFNSKLRNFEHQEVIEYLVDITEDFNFSQLKEVLVSVYCLGYDLGETIKRIQNGPEEITSSREEYLDEKLEELTENDIINARVKALR